MEPLGKQVLPQLTGHPLRTSIHLGWEIRACLFFLSFSIISLFNFTFFPNKHAALEKQEASHVLCLCSWRSENQFIFLSLSQRQFPKLLHIFGPNGTPGPYYSLCHELLIFCVIFSLCMCSNSLYLPSGIWQGNLLHRGLISFSDLRKQLLSQISQESSSKFP